MEGGDQDWGGLDAWLGHDSLNGDWCALRREAWSQDGVWASLSPVPTQMEVQTRTAGNGFLRFLHNEVVLFWTPVLLWFLILCPLYKWLFSSVTFPFRLGLFLLVYLRSVVATYVRNNHNKIQRVKRNSTEDEVFLSCTLAVLFNYRDLNPNPNHQQNYICKTNDKKTECSSDSSKISTAA